MTTVLVAGAILMAIVRLVWYPAIIHGLVIHGLVLPRRRNILVGIDASKISNGDGPHRS
jgi:hypothetical protein